MDESVASELTPLNSLQHFARLSSHSGRGTLHVDEQIVAGHAELILPAEGNALVAFLADSRTLRSAAMAGDLVI